MKHLLDHVKPGMTQHQIDSLYERAKSNKDKNDANIKDLVMAAQKANINSNASKTNGCDIATKFIHTANQVAIREATGETIFYRYAQPRLGRI